MSPEEAAKQRISYITRRQELLETAVTDLQASLYERILVSLDKITQDPVFLDRLFREFTQKDHIKVISQFAQDIVNIGKQNDTYFTAIYEGTLPKNYAVAKKEADIYLLERFGLSPAGKVVEDGFLDSFIKDPTIKREVKAFAYKAQTTGMGMEKFKQGFKSLIQGADEGQGVLERYYSNYAYDTYQQADSTIQDVVSDKLGLQAAFYAGGTIAGTRAFCRARNGKVFLKSEIALFGTSKDKYGGYSNKALGKFDGKPKNYNPKIDIGGHSCRHHYNYITDKMAVRRRDDLEIVDGELRVKW